MSVYLCIGAREVRMAGESYFTLHGATLMAGDGQRFGTLQMLDWREISAYAAWCGLHGGHPLLDAFELECINSGILWLWPQEDAPEGVEADQWEALEIQHADDGLRILWEPRMKCHSCGGTGWIGDPDDDPIDGECPSCAGGYVAGPPVVTDANGTVLETPQDHGDMR